MAGVYPTTCPFPRAFDHNAVAVTGLLVVAALAAEAALRLMAAGNGFFIRPPSVWPIGVRRRPA